MKGITHKTETGWVVKWVEYCPGHLTCDSHDPDCSRKFGFCANDKKHELPLHPDNIKDAVEGNDYEFETARLNEDGSVSSNGEHNVALLIIPKQQEIVYTQEQVLNMLWSLMDWNDEEAKAWLKNNYDDR